MKPLVLASASPRRKELLESIGVEIRVCPGDAAELAEGDPPQLVLANARSKCNAIADTVAEDAIIVGADTVVVIEGVLLGKPDSLETAREYLKRLSGNTHSVFTGVAVLDRDSGTFAQGVEETRVTFRPLSKDEINLFVETVRPLDRAGAYTVDGPGSLLVERYDGCYANVLGLPVPRLDELLREIGDGLHQRIQPESARFL